MAAAAAPAASAARASAAVADRRNRRWQAGPKWALLLLALATAGAARAAEGLSERPSAFDVATTESRLVQALEQAGMTVFARVDHAAGARGAGLALAPTRVVIFGNPAVGTRLMQCRRSTAIDLPMKALIWREDGRTRLAFNSPAYLRDRHAVEGCKGVLETMRKALEGFARAATTPAP